MAEGGLLGFDVSTWFAPAGTPPAIVARLDEAFAAALRTADVRERQARMGAEPSPTTPQQLAELVRSELAKYEKVVKFSGAWGRLSFATHPRQQSDFRDKLG
jgi:tripartite-type tricarboxylate transporter receptor subunit TctC